MRCCKRGDASWRLKAAFNIESANKQAQAAVRTIKLALEVRLKCDIPDDHPIMDWLIKHAVANRNRFHVGKDGFTAIRRSKGRNLNRKIVEFGECVWYCKPRSAGKEK